MRTVLITGGTNGIGKGIAMYLLKKGHRVIAIGSSSKKGEAFHLDARDLNAEDRAIYIQADLSSVKENFRIIEEVKSKYPVLDALILCAQYQRHSTKYLKTEEGFEFTFGLYYLSRYILSYGLRDCLEDAENPVIINVCSPGMRGVINWSDLQYENGYNSIKAIMHGSRLNDLLGVSFSESNINWKTKYVLFNPGAVQTSGAMEAYDQPFLRILIKLVYKLVGKPISEAIVPIIEHIENPPHSPLSAFMQRKPVSLTMDTFNKQNAKRLSDLTKKMIEEVIKK